MSTKKEFKKYRKRALEDIRYQNVYADGIIETELGCFTKTYVCIADIMEILDKMHDMILSNVDEDNPFNKVGMQITFYDQKFYLTLSVKRPAYDLAVKAFDIFDNCDEFQEMTFVERMELLHTLYQNDDSFVERFIECSYYKKDAHASLSPHSRNYPVAEKLKNFKRNGKVSKDLFLPLEMKAEATEFEFEGNYIRFFYLKNLSRYLTQEFLDILVGIEDVCFSIHMKPLSQTEIVKYTTEKFENAKDLKESEIMQKEFFETVNVDLERSARNGEKMFLMTLVIGIRDDSLDVLNEKVDRLTKEMTETYVVKVLNFQQKDALNTFLPFCDDRLSIQSVVYTKPANEEEGELNG